MFTGSGNENIDLLVEKFDSENDKLSDLISELPFASGRDKETLYIKILKILLFLRSYSADWTKRNLAEYYVAADYSAVQDYAEITGEDPESFTDIPADPLQRTADDFLSYVLGALDSIQAQALRFYNGHATSAFEADLLAGVKHGKSIPDARLALKKFFRDGLILITDKNGKGRRFGLGYYILMTATFAMQTAKSEAAIARTQEQGNDLVRVSDNYSTVGDWCDNLRGKIFSISGMNPDYPPLSSVPNGKCPFHPNCHHFLRPYIPAVVDNG